MFRHFLKTKVSAAFFQAQCRVQPLIKIEQLTFFEKKYGVNISLESKKINDGRIVKELKISQNSRMTNKAIALFQGTNALIDEHKIENACRLASKYGDYEIYMRHYPGTGEGKVTNFSTKDITDDSVEFLKRLATHQEIVYVKAIGCSSFKTTNSTQLIIINQYDWAKRKLKEEANCGTYVVFRPISHQKELPHARII